MKTYQIGPISFSESGYKKFVSLTKEKQIERVTESLNPKDPAQAQKLLARVPNGSISTENVGEAQNVKTASGANNRADNKEGKGSEKS